MNKLRLELVFPIVGKKAEATIKLRWNSSFVSTWLFFETLDFFQKKIAMEQSATS